VLAVRGHQSQRVDGRKDVGAFACRIYGYSHMLAGYAGGHAQYATAREASGAEILNCLEVDIPDALRE
jgi:hypothetical protein